MKRLTSPRPSPKERVRSSERRAQDKLGKGKEFGAGSKTVDKILKE